MTDTALARADDNLIWIDLEMTGLYPDTDRIIEVAVIVTDPHLQRRVAGPVFAMSFFASWLPLALVSELRITVHDLSLGIMKIA